MPFGKRKRATNAVLFVAKSNRSDSSISILLQKHVEKFSMEASTGVQEDTQGAERCPVVQIVPWKQMMDRNTFISLVIYVCR